ncbi:hypothetical protein FSP39_004655 [Pinctada imbricata]|uniref:Large ribosomal subunit protein bL21m n=1 Tax=Pinctada imbricata TaxID=66713 RepID=A0AA88Y2N1_PINIB|nr:hypothetical protein FSP39_004655 [Pinctada imbricata]
MDIASKTVTFRELIEQVNNTIQSPDVGRLFAVIHLRGNQRKVTTEDIIIVNGDFPPTVGERIRLEKVLMVGGKDFSLIGRPLLSRNVVKVEATVIEKTLSNFRVSFNYLNGKNYKRFKGIKNCQHLLLLHQWKIIPSLIGYCCSSMKHSIVISNRMT